MLVLNIQPLKAQKAKLSNEEIDRFASLGKLWGMLHYFHPHVLNGSVVSDSLILPAARSLAANPSAASYKAAVADMLGRTGDGATRLINASKADIMLLTKSQTASLHKLPDNIHYIALPTDVNGEAELSKTGLMDDTWKSAAGIILDLRKKDYETDRWSDMQFFADFFPTIQKELLGAKVLPGLQERTAGHNGFVSQTQNMPNVYSSGWRSVTVAEEIKGTGNAYGKPVVIVLHQNSYEGLISRCLMLQAAGVCKVVIDGETGYAANGNTTQIQLSDGLTCAIRISDLYLSNGKALPAPAYVAPITDNRLNGGHVQKCLSLIRSDNPTEKSASESISLTYKYPKPGRYAETFYPDASLRLMGLYNWWNAIHYFFPYKHLTEMAWDSVLYTQIPVMLQAKDSVEYAFAVRAMVSKINDSHGFITNVNPVTPIRSVLGYWPPLDMRFIEGKLYITDIGTDNTQNMQQLQLWDEVLGIDGVPVAVAAEKLRNFIASSNESTYKRDVVRYLPNGPQYSKMLLTIKRDATESKVELIRTGRSTLRSSSVDFNDNYKTIQTMQDSVLYINMGNLTWNMADSLAKELHKQKVLLFDIRNYPQGTAWTIAPRLTTVAKKAVLFDKPLVTPAHITGGEAKENLGSSFIVMPASTKRSFTGRVFILCNEQTQSQAEYTIMMFQGATACTVIGSQTAGADGNVTDVAIPGGYQASFSGLGILYPDGTQTQRTGIRIDETIKPTLQGLKAGKDEVLEYALKLIREGR